MSATHTDSPAPLPARQEPAQVPVETLVRKRIEGQGPWLEAVLRSADLDPVRFQLLALTAAKATPDLLECFATPAGEVSFLLALKQAAEVGLEPNTPLQECWLLPRRKGGVMECQLSIGYVGEIKLARRSGEIKTIFAEVVRENDEFRYARGAAEDDFYHQPAVGDRGELTHAYAVVRYMSGGYDFMVLDRDQIEARRAMSDSWKNEKARPYSPWTKWTEAMWRKSAIRALRPFLPLTAQAAKALATDERTLNVDQTGQRVVDAETGEVLELTEAA